jgi:hypothetical protein
MRQVGSFDVRTPINLCKRVPLIYLQHWPLSVLFGS